MPAPPMVSGNASAMVVSRHRAGSVTALLAKGSYSLLLKGLWRVRLDPESVTLWLYLTYLGALTLAPFNFTVAPLASSA